jgi:hypothetical protein
MTSEWVWIRFGHPRSPGLSSFSLIPSRVTRRMIIWPPNHICSVANASGHSLVHVTVRYHQSFRKLWTFCDPNWVKIVSCQYAIIEINKCSGVINYSPMSHTYWIMTDNASVVSQMTGNDRLPRDFCEFFKRDRLRFESANSWMHLQRPVTFLIITWTKILSMNVLWDFRSEFQEARTGGRDLNHLWSV